MLYITPYITTMEMRTIRSVAFSQRPLPGCMCLLGQVWWLQRKHLMLKYWLTAKEKDWEIATMEEVPGLKTVPLILATGDKVNIRTDVADYLHGGGWSNFKGWKVY